MRSAHRSAAVMPGANLSALPADVALAFANLRKASRMLRGLATNQKNLALTKIADRVLSESTALIQANREDIERLPSDTTSAFRDRLMLDEKRIAGMVESLRQVALLPDPV